MIKLLKCIFGRKSLAFYYSQDYILDTMSGTYHRWDSTHANCHFYMHSLDYLSEYDVTLHGEIKPCKYCIK